MPKVEIINLIGLASIQDIGRPQYRRYGIPVSGFMDHYSAKGANKWIGKESGSPLIELIGGAIKLKFDHDTMVAITGAEAAVKVGLKEYKTPTRIHIQTGEVLEIGSPVRGFITYLAFENDLNLQQHFGSCSTLVQAKLGGIDGKNLKKGDVLSFTGKYTLEQQTNYRSRYYSDSISLRCHTGPEYHYLDNKSAERFFRESFKLTHQISRIGYRLAGDPLVCQSKSFSSRLVMRGTVQLPPDGQPIILMSDAQTTGGYPRIGQIIAPDLDLLAQMKPGATIRFQNIELIT